MKQVKRLQHLFTEVDAVGEGEVIVGGILYVRYQTEFLKKHREIIIV